MTNIHVVGRGHSGRAGRVVHDWWPVPAFIATSILAQQVLIMSRYDVGGHAAEHLAGAGIPFMAAALLAILFWATPAARRQIDVIAAAAAWFAATLVVMVGNLRVVSDLIDAGHAHTPTDRIPDVADHALANSSIWYGVAAAVVLVAAFGRRRHVGSVALAGALVAMIFPPWIIPGAGVVVLTIVRCVAWGKQHRMSPAAR